MNNETTVVTETSPSSVNETTVVSLTEAITTSVQTSTATKPTAAVSKVVPNSAVSEVTETEMITSSVSVETSVATETVAEKRTETSIVSDSLISETKLVSETTEITTVAAIVEPVASTETIDTKKIISLAVIIVLIVVMVILTLKTSKKKKNNSDEKKSAKDIDAERISNTKKVENEKNNKKKTKVKKILPKNVVNTMPYKKVLKDNIWLIDDKTYSKAYVFQDINYNLGDAEQQSAFLQNYCNFLNTLDDTVDCQITMLNSSINIKSFENKVLLKTKNDEYDNLRTEYNDRVLKENISKGQNSIQKHLYITLTISSVNESYATQKFKTLDLSIKASFERIGNTRIRPLTSQERVELLKNFFVGTEVVIPTLTDEDFETGMDKVYCSPDYFEFKSDYFMFNNTYAKTVFIKEYPSKAVDSIMTDLLGTNLKLMVTHNIIAFDPAKARKLVQSQITAIDTNMAQRESKAAQHGNFSSQMPMRIKNQLDGYKSLYEKLTIQDQKLYHINTIIMVTAESYNELNSNMDIIASSLKRNGCMYGEMKWQQEDGMVDCLPIGSHRRFEWHRRFPTESIAILQPFNVKEVQQRGSVYYGLNVLSDNLISFDRMKSLINPSGFILGCPGSGKSFTAKREMMDVFMRYDDADIMIIDPEREYPAVVNMFGGESVKISLGSQNYINPFDFDVNLLDDPEVDVIGDKCQLITSFISCMDTNPLNALNAQECSFIDRCVRDTYDRSSFWKTMDNKDMPTLGDFYEVMKYEDDVDEAMKQKLLITIEMYVKGSAKYFNNKTNVDVDNRVISYDIKDLSGNLKTQAMLL
ncbi:MAG: VirB4-like conjugal transfer ATPase, CD1110 family, partial [Erysipelotrichaceae bacterium]